MPERNDDISGRRARSLTPPFRGPAGVRRPASDAAWAGARPALFVPPAVREPQAPWPTSAPDATTAVRPEPVVPAAPPAAGEELPSIDTFLTVGGAPGSLASEPGLTSSATELASAASPAPAFVPSDEANGEAQAEVQPDEAVEEPSFMIEDTVLPASPDWLLEAPNAGEIDAPFSFAEDETPAWAPEVQHEPASTSHGSTDSLDAGPDVGHEQAVTPRPSAAASAWPEDVWEHDPGAPADATSSDDGWAAATTIGKPTPAQLDALGTPEMAARWRELAGPLANDGQAELTIADALEVIAARIRSGELQVAGYESGMGEAAALTAALAAVLGLRG